GRCWPARCGRTSPTRTRTAPSCWPWPKSCCDRRRCRRPRRDRARALACAVSLVVGPERAHGRAGHAGAGGRLAGAQLQRVLALFLQGRHRLAGRGGGVRHRGRGVPFRRLGAGAARPRGHRRRHRPAAGAREPGPCGGGGRALPGVLRLLRLEVVDAVPRSVGGQNDHLVNVRAAAHHSLRNDGGGHDAARLPVVAAEPGALHFPARGGSGQGGGQGGRGNGGMSVLALGLLYGAATLTAMFSGMPIAFALGAVAVLFMAVFMPASSLDTVTQNVYEEMSSITLLSIPLFILKGAAIGRSN